MGISYSLLDNVRKPWTSRDRGRGARAGLGHRRDGVRAPTDAGPPDLADDHPRVGPPRPHPRGRPAWEQVRPVVGPGVDRPAKTPPGLTVNARCCNHGLGWQRSLCRRTSAKIVTTNEALGRP